MLDAKKGSFLGPATSLIQMLTRTAMIAAAILLIVCLVLSIIDYLTYREGHNVRFSSVQRPETWGSSLSTDPPVLKEDDHTHDSTLSIDDSVARALSRKMRVFCWIPSREQDIPWKVHAVNQTWVQRCDGHVFFIQTDKAWAWPDVVSLGAQFEGWDTLSSKSAEALQYIYMHYNLDDYDWFFKADDNSYVIMENLRLLLSKYDPKQPVYLGHLFDAFPKGGPGFMGGGAGFVFSREAFRLLLEQGYHKNKCPVTEGHGEDRHIGNCLYNVGVGRHYTRDVYGRESFHQFSPQQYIVDPGEAAYDIHNYFKFPQSIGPECCSEATISFHYVEPDMILIMDHILYRTSVYGHQQKMAKLWDLFQPRVVPMP